MRRSTLLAAGAVLAAVAVSSALVVSSAGPAASAGGRTISLYYHDVQQTPIDVGDKGDSAGDRFFFSGDVFSRKGGRKVGRAGGVCDTVGSAASHPDLLCVFNFNLRDGQIAVQGLNDKAVVLSGRPFSMPIVGGTGAYRGARGEAIDRVPTGIPDQADSYFTLRLQ